MAEKNGIWTGGHVGLSAHGKVEYDAGDACDALVNLTPHALTIDFCDGLVVRVPTHGVARVEAVEQRGGAPTTLCAWVPDCLAPVMVTALRYGARVAGGLPVALANGEHWRAPVEPAGPGMWQREKGPRIWFIVSLLTGLELSQRHDVLVPGPEVRGVDGRITLGLRRIA